MADNVFEMIFFINKNFNWKEKYSLSTGGALEMLGSISGFAPLVRTDAPQVFVVDSFLQSHALRTKTLPTTLEEVLSTVW